MIVRLPFNIGLCQAQPLGKVTRIVLIGTKYERQPQGFLSLDECEYYLGGTQVLRSLLGGLDDCPTAGYLLLKYPRSKQYGMAK